MDRRSFISKSLLATAACYGASGAGFSEVFANVTAQKKKNRIGIQLYSIREFLSKDFEGSIKKLGDIGYAYAEAYGFNGEKFLSYTLKETNKMLNDVGMQLSGTHAGTGWLPEDVGDKAWDYWRKSADEMKAAGGRQIAQSFLPEAKTLDSLKKLADQFNKIGEICKKGGIKFGYHNHHTEFQTVEGSVLYDVLLQNTDPNLVFFQMDMGHVVNGGGDIMTYISKYPKRFLSWHASDFKKGQGYVLLGQGDVPYDQLFKLAKSYGVEDLTMEHEAGQDRFKICEDNFKFLAKYSWTKK